MERAQARVATISVHSLSAVKFGAKPKCRSSPITRRACPRHRRGRTIGIRQCSSPASSRASEKRRIGCFGVHSSGGSCSRPPDRECFCSADRPPRGDNAASPAGLARLTLINGWKNLSRLREAVTVVLSGHRPSQRRDLDEIDGSGAVRDPGAVPPRGASDREGRSVRRRQRPDRHQPRRQHADPVRRRLRRGPMLHLARRCELHDSDASKITALNLQNNWQPYGKRHRRAGGARPWEHRASARRDDERCERSGIRVGPSFCVRNMSPTFA